MGNKEIGNGARRGGERNGEHGGIKWRKEGHKVLGVINAKLGATKFGNEDKDVRRIVGIGSKEFTGIVAGNIGDGKGGVGRWIWAVGENIEDAPFGEDG